MLQEKHLVVKVWSIVHQVQRIIIVRYCTPITTSRVTLFLKDNTAIAPMTPITRFDLGTCMDIWILSNSSEVSSEVVNSHAHSRKIQ